MYRFGYNVIVDVLQEGNSELYTLQLSSISWCCEQFALV